MQEPPKQVEKRAPAPWSLEGSGYILVYRFAKNLMDGHELPFPADLGPWRVRLGVVMIVDYQHSDVGPYHELLVIPGPYRFDRGLYPAITKIYVSTWESVINGRHNWGIPKEEAPFQKESHKNTDRIVVGDPARPILDINLRHFGFEFPVTTTPIPNRLCTMMQPYHGFFYETILSGKGRMKPARVLDVKIDEAHFPNFGAGRLLAAFKVTRFELAFPVPLIHPWPEPGPQ